MQPEPGGSYTGMLAGSYVLGPLLGLAVGGALSEVEAPDGVAVLAATPMFLMPMAVHFAHGQETRAAVSLGGMAGGTLGGAIVGGLVGYAENRISCDPEQESDCDMRGLDVIIPAIAIGAVAGYVTAGVLDVVFQSSAPQAAEQAPGDGAAQLWLVPVARTAREPAARRAAAVDGVLVGLTLRL
jgi:hypothetical protein